MGDPAGIGLELAIKAWQLRAERALPPFVLIADPRAVAECAQRLGRNIPCEVVPDASHAVAAFFDKLPVLDLPLAVRAQAGQPSEKNAAAIIASIERAVDLVLRGACLAMTTNPIAKSVLTSAGFPHPGHTEFVAHLTSAATGRRLKPVMMLASPELRVVPLTVHIPLSAVPGALSRPLIQETVHITAEALRSDFGIAHPRIAVAGLNPHAGESGTMGREEIDVIAPAIAMLRAEGLAVSGPYPADTLFHAEMRRSYDAVVAMYHDQALIPLKTLAFDQAVNITLGLPIIRTSPDHGTAFDIAGHGTANPESLLQALLMARAMSDVRRASQRP